MFIPECPIAPIFHFLLKVHKGCNPLTGRPIVPECVFRPVGRPPVTAPGYLRDTKQLLAKLRVSFFLSRYSGYSLIHQEFIMLTLEHLLTTILCLTETAIYINAEPLWEPNSPPSLANLYMGWWSLIFGPDSPCHSDILFYCCYIDNPLFTVSDEFGCLGDWLSFMNDNSLNLRFTGCCNSKSIDFFDVRLRGEGNRVVSSLFRKPMAGNMFLRADSSHLKHTFSGIPVGQFLRLKRICSEEVDYRWEALNMFWHFEDRGYPKSVLDRAMGIADKTPCKNVKNKRNKLKNKNRCNKSPPHIQAPFF